MMVSQKVGRVMIPFTKMHGLGNDFVVIEDLDSRFSKLLTPENARKICDRRFGVGADQILWLRPPQGSQSDLRADVRMEILNPDGSVAEMCGNGIRAVAIYLRDHTSLVKTSYCIETLAGLKLIELRGDHVVVNMGAPQLGQGALSQKGEEIQTCSGAMRFFEVGMGNPHAVFFVEKLEDSFITQVGPEVEKHPRFPQRTNVGFVKLLDSHSIALRVWERGAGLTLACGTGACGAAVASIATGRVQSPVNVSLPGGDLKISWDGGSNPVFMEGPAQEVFQGEVYL